MGENFIVEQLFDLTPEKLGQINEEQERLRALANSRARLSRDERARARGVELEVHHQKTGNRDGLAEALGMQGRYGEALEAAERDDLKDFYRAMAAAVEQDDEMCGCDPFVRCNGLALPNQSDEFRGFSEKHGKTISFIRCHECGALNARAPLEHLEQVRAVRDAAVRDGRGKTAADVFGNTK